MPRIYDPGFYAGLIKTLGLRENVLADVPQGLLLTIDVGQLLSTPPPLAVTQTSQIRPKGALRWFNPTAALGSDFTLSSATLPVDQNGVLASSIGSKRWQVLSLVALLTTSAVAGNRFPGLIWQSSTLAGNQPWLGQTATAVLASTVTTFTWAFGLPAAGLGQIQSVSSFQVIPSLPSVYMEAGWQLRSFTQGLLGGDQWSGIWLYVEEY